MARIPPSVLREYLFGGQVSTRGCLRPLRLYQPTLLYHGRYHATQAPETTTESATEPTIPFRKQLKDEAKKKKAAGAGKKSKQDNQKLDNWELTVGIEIHAQLNTSKKIFSAASSTINDAPNTRVALFDVAMPGSQPSFQKETLIPALRAALALNCIIQKSSRFDRKHYFHWDQPAGYQITQYYEPFAKDGYITLYAHDGIAAEDGEEVRIGIKQIQMEQDTAKTVSQPGDIHLLDFNRVGLPLIEIITLPQIHHPSTAAALVRKVQISLGAVDACVLGMQSGGLRADVNVSVRRRDSEGSSEYGGVKSLGQRTEIKNLSSFKAVEDAIIAERDRQIEVLEAGGVIEGETRGWTIGSTETRRLRGKEGEVDYRYMPDPDLGPVIVGEDLVNHLTDTLGVLPDEEINILTDAYGLTAKDAMSMISLNDGGRVEYFRDVVDKFLLLSGEAEFLESGENKDIEKAGRQCGNWVLHEMGGLTNDLASLDNPLQMTPEGDCLISASNLAQLVFFLDTNAITGRTAKKVLNSLFEHGLNGEESTTQQIIEEDGLWFQPLSDSEYSEMAKQVCEEEMKAVEDVLKGSAGKINYLLGKMIRLDTDGRVDAVVARKVLVDLVEGFREEQ